MSQPLAPPHGDTAEKAERRWATIAVIIVVMFVVVATFAGVHQAAMPQARVETTDPRTLHLRGEFIESNLGSAVEADGSVTLRGPSPRDRRAAARLSDSRQDRRNRATHVGAFVASPGRPL